MWQPPTWAFWLAAGMNTFGAAALLGLGCLFWLVGHRRTRTLRELTPPHLPSPPSVTFVLPVRGTHLNSAANWVAQVHGHGYPGVCEHIFVVAEEDDEARLLIEQLQKDGSLHSDKLRVLVAGHATRTSQKLHQQLAGIRASSSELVLLLDDDMLLHPGAVSWLAQALRDDPSALAACGFSFDVPATKTLLSHAGCMLRLIMAIGLTGDTASGDVGKAWGGCCMLRAADLGEDGPGSLLFHWQDNGYSDDWILTQLGKRLGRSIVNPPGCLFLNLVRYPTLRPLFNFHARQMYVLDTYLPPERSYWTEAPNGGGGGPGAYVSLVDAEENSAHARRSPRASKPDWSKSTHAQLQHASASGSRWCGDGHRLEAWLLLHAMLLAGVWLHLALGLIAMQLVFLPLAGLDAWRLRAPDAVPLFSVPDDAALIPPPDWEGSAPLLASAASLGAVGLAVPIALAGGAHAVRMQSALLSHLMADGGERLQREARWSAWRSVVGFCLFLLLGVYWCLAGFYSSSVVWSGIRYYKRRGQVERVERLQPSAPSRSEVDSHAATPTTVTPLLQETAA